MCCFSVKTFHVDLQWLSTLLGHSRDLVVISGVLNMHVFECVNAGEAENKEVRCNEEND